MELLDNFDHAAITAAARLLPAPPTTALNEYLPDVTTPDIEWEISRISDANRAARFRSYDAPVEIGSGPSVVRQSGEIPAVGEGYLVGEYRRLLQEQMRGSNISEPLRNAVLNYVQRGVATIHNRIELARGQVLTTGKFTLSGEGRLHIEADFGVPGGNFVTPAAPWTSTSDITGELATWAALAKIAPDVMLVGDLALPKLLKSQELRDMYGNSFGTPNQLTVEQANQVLAARGLPVVVPVRRNRVMVPDPSTGAYVEQDVFHREKIVMLPKGFLGETKWGPTFEALELASTGVIEAQQAPGIVAAVYREGNPGKRFTVVNAVAIPVLAEPDSLVVADVVP